MLLLREPRRFYQLLEGEPAGVIKLVEYLRGQGVAVWMDESDIHGATMWTKEIVEAIRASSCLHPRHQPTLDRFQKRR